MYVKVTTQKQLDELFKIAEKNGWETAGPTNLSDLIEESSYGVFFLNKEEGEVSSEYGRYYSNTNFNFDDIKTFKRVLNHPIYRLGIFIVLKLKHGIKIGCTTFSNDDIKSVLSRIKNPSKTFKSGEFEDGRFVVGDIYFEYDSLELLLKEGKDILKELKNRENEDTSIEVDEDGDVIYDSYRFTSKEVLELAKKLKIKI